ncbi:MAG: ethylbenzene dehydrogenase-related protein, partial [Syntrophales bacterium]|nr:ethylbenzene dehydrogenase-related protein [Syntrophales bacterium]
HQASGTNFISKAVPEEPAMDRIDGIWNTVGGISVQLMPMGAHGLMGTHRNVELRSVHTNTNIYLYASWPDPTESVTKDIWIKKDDGSWEQSADDEDRLSFVWEIGNSMSEFSRGRGTMSLCHPDPADSRNIIMSTRNTGGRADLWHWKAARTNPAGYSDDQYLDGEGRKSDPGLSSYGDNKSSGGNLPALMPSGGVAGSAFLFDSEAVPFNDEKFKPGDRLPAYILRTPNGDRADIRAYGIHRHGKWTVVLQRQLKTGHDDTDVQFEPGEAYIFGVALFDNAGDDKHLKSMPLRLSLERESR